MSLRHSVYHQLYPGRGPTDHSTVLNRLTIGIIIAAVTTSIMATEPELTHRLPRLFRGLEYLFGAAFLVEYVLRLWVAAEKPGDAPAWRKRLVYAFTPLAIVDLFVVVTTLSPYFLADTTVLRLLRLLRLIMLAKFGRFSRSFHQMAEAMHQRRHELMVTLSLAGFLLLFGATALYVAEGSVQPDKFGSIPRALWWSIITLTTVGYGDVSPITPLGKFLAAIVALAGIGLVAMPTGIMAAAFSEAMDRWRKEHEEAERQQNEP